MVRKSLRTNEATTSTPEGEQDFTNTTITPERDPPNVEKTKPHGVLLIRESLDRYVISSTAKDILVASWRPGTTKQYQTYLGKWQEYCEEHSFDRFEPGMENAIEFLVSYTSGLGYSAINTACSALSTVLVMEHV